jgi:hypothetical protein
MRKFFGLLVMTAVLAASLAVAGQMTAEQAMQKMMSCVSCAPYAEYPELGPNIRYDIFETSSGFVAAFMLADEKLAPKFRECEKKCEAARATAMKLSEKEVEAKLCPFCSGMFKLMARDDVTIEEFQTKLGQVVVASASSDKGVEALHGYAKTAKETSDLLDKAAAKMMGAEKN